MRKCSLMSIRLSDWKVPKELFYFLTFGLEQISLFSLNRFIIQKSKIINRISINNKNTVSIFPKQDAKFLCMV